MVYIELVYNNTLSDNNNSTITEYIYYHIDEVL